MSVRKTLLCVAALGIAAACDDQPTSPVTQTSPSFTVSSADREAVLQGLEPAASPEEALARINDRLAAAGLSIAVLKAEYVTGDSDLDAAGQTVFAKDRELRLGSKWVPGDARRLADGNLITQLKYTPFAPANFGTPAQFDSRPAINASFATWDSQTCSNLNIVERPDTGVFPSAIFAGGDPFVADIVTLGFLPGVFFDLVLGPGSSDNVLGVTFTFIFIEGPGGPPTDIDNNGRNDTALKEVWYNDDFTWSTDGAGGTIDVETVALHENGHALELGHMGYVFITDENGKLHVAPRAVMNAFILGVLREPLGTDNGAYCGNFADWPD